MTLMANGKKVDALALGGVEFYPMNENKASNLIACSYAVENTTGKHFYSIALSQKLRDDSTITIKDLIDKGERIRLILTVSNGEDNFYDFSKLLVSNTVDLSKPDSNGHFNFQWADNNVSTNTYCCSTSSIITTGGPQNNVFTIWSDALNDFNHDYTIKIEILYSDAS